MDTSIRDAQAQATSESYLLACVAGDGTVVGKAVAHGDVIAARERIVAVLGGYLHPGGECSWCDRLRRRCRSHRQF